MTVVAQKNITQSFTLNQSQILTLLSGFTIVPAEPDYVNVFTRASLSYRFGTTVFTNVNNVLSFKVNNRVISNSLNATNILGASQSNSITFVPANPYPTIFSSDDNQALKFFIDVANVLGGDASSSLSLNVTYDIYQLT